MKPYAHQKLLLDLNPARYLIAHECGTGKTQTSLFLAQKNNETALIIAPKALKENWKRAIKYFNDQHLIISKEEFRRDWDKLQKYNCIIVDEFHFFANLKSQLSKSLLKYNKKHNPTYVYGLTATPYCSNVMNIFALARHLGHKWDYWSFFNRFYYNVPMGARMVPMQRKNIEKDVAQLVKSIGNTCRLQDCADVPEQTFETIYFELTPQQKKAITAIDDTQAITRWTRTHTIENGLRIGDEYTKDEYFDCLKNDYIVSMAEENPKMAIFCRYNMQIEMLKTLLTTTGKKVFVISGEVKDRDSVVKEIEDNENCVALIQASCGVGFEIPSVPVVVFASMSFSFVDYQQSLGRVLRINKLKKNVYIHLVVKGGVDEAVYNCIMAKQDFNIEVYNK